MACDLAEGRRTLPGGPIFARGGWLVEHCIGPLGVGTLIVKPRRHVERFADLSVDEVAALGPLMHLTTKALDELLSPDQTYICQWAHAGWKAGHIHFVVQPSWDRLGRTHERPGPFLQVEMFDAGEHPPEEGVAAFCARARETMARLEASEVVGA